MNRNKDIAQTYARQGVYIFPCREVDSKGGVAKAPYVEGGWHSATTDEGQIRDWGARWPNALIGLPCRSNKIIVIDADRHGQDDGVATFLKMATQNAHDTNSQPLIATPRDGYHHVFRRPVHLGDTKGKIAPAIDIRDRAYVIAAGSVMANGLCYSLQNGSIEQLAAGIGNATLPELPDWLSVLVAKPDPKKNTAPGYVAHQTFPPSGDLRQRLAGLVRTVARANPGERNTKLHWAACRMAEIVWEGGLQRPTAIAILVEVGVNVGLPKAEAQLTAESGINNSKVGVKNGN
ncbi:MAG: bifunctional DNA primase/polymerase [Formivibrio sp.]|nr:bifunctional DNA primase/polymerase [Formivibrio sp.]